MVTIAATYNQWVISFNTLGLSQTINGLLGLHQMTVGATLTKKIQEWSWLLIAANILVKVGNSDKAFKSNNQTAKYCSRACYKSPERRFWRKIIKPANQEACWKWTGSVENGYGRIGYKVDGERLIHRIYYKLHNGEIPEGMCVCHSRAGSTSDTYFSTYVDSFLQDLSLSVGDRTPVELKTRVRAF